MLRRPPGDPAVLRQTGSMGETAFYPVLSGRDNLRAVARRCGLGDHRVDVVLGQAGLAERAGDAVAGYSCGMRQRLGVAAAALSGPFHLVLFEGEDGPRSRCPAGPSRVSRRTWLSSASVIRETISALFCC